MKVPKAPLPRAVRDELRMTVVLKEYSTLKSGKPRRLPDQYAFMDQYFHGKVPSHPPQIQLLAEGHANYSGLYDEVITPITNKNTKSKSTSPPVTLLKLRDILTNNPS